MDFTPTETQRDISDLARGVLASGGWKELAQADLLSLALPEWLDGNGFGVAEVTALLAEVGRSGVSLPAYPTLALGVLPVAAWGDRSLQTELLTGVGTGEKVLTAALREPSDPFPARPSVTVSGKTVSGTKVGVPYAAEAGRILVTASSGDGDPVVVVIDPADASATRTHTAGGEPEYTLTMENVPVRGVLREGAAGGLYRLAVAGAVAVADGAVAAALDLTKKHVGTREQFGRPLATFQAAAQHVADVYITARTLHLAATAACWRLGEGLEADEDLNVAAYWLASRAPEAMLTCHHLHGGLGMDVTYPMPRYSGLVKDLVRLVGGADYRLDRLAASREGAENVHRSH
ncbi:MAG: acyl-CoA/acyl-ACP dehydrogenase [Streptosporangiales bacterium]|nr:acyl-CoA/acyl-ACP dehydrogenase [Streptosporangiales bacterium]